MLLEIKNLSVSYGQVRALRDVSLHVAEKELVALIGPNGAGKSTTIKAVMGLLADQDGSVDGGEISFRGKSVSGLKTHELVQIGIGLVPEGRRLFPSMTVLENLEMGTFITTDKEIDARLSAVFDLFPLLADRKKQPAGTLSTGEQQLLAIGRAMMLDPKMLLLDEPSLGLSPNYVRLVFDKLVAINRNGTTILLVEQNARQALDICQRAYVFDIGTIGLSGTREQLLATEKVRDIYLKGK